MNEKLAARAIVNIVGLVLMAVAFYHFGGQFAVLGFLGWILRYQSRTIIK